METPATEYDLIVIGGGASGMMAAGVAAARGLHVLLLEKNKTLGEKLKISGGGRCNITNATYDIRTLLPKYGDAEQFLFSPFSKFGVKDTFDFFEKRKLPLVVQKQNRAFPHTEKALDVVQSLLAYMQEGKVDIKTGSTVQKILTEKNQITGVVVKTKTAVETYNAKNYILATGGVSHPETGSTGDGFGWLRDLGHSVKTPTPNLVPLATNDPWSRILSGNSIAEGKITFFVEQGEKLQKKFSEKGKILFTHFGLSGPLILNLASKVSDLLQEGKVVASIDAFPSLDIGALDAKVLKAFDDSKNKMLKNVLRDFVPEGMAPGMALLITSTNLETKVNSITKEERRKIVDILKALPVTVTGLMGYNRAIVADGGVDISEIDTKTMRSKVCPNLFITGDLLDINRPSGGYSLQLCWTTGFVAGSNA